MRQEKISHGDMSWLGKVLGGAFGFLMGGPLGAILGAAAGHQYDRGRRGPERLEPRLEIGDQRRVQMAFFTATFSVMGHLAKADGAVSAAEINAAKAVMDRFELSTELRRAAIQLFTEGKKQGFPLNDALEQFRNECHHRYPLFRLFMEVLLEMAYADGPLRFSEERLLLQICDRLHLSRLDFYALKARVDAAQRLAHTGYERTRPRSPPPPPRRSALDEAYIVLGIRPTASDAEIKSAYRRMIGQHHPDKLVASGAPEERVRSATVKTQQIRKAYELIVEQRNLS
ncbi:co-chaperone DjlA [Methylotetracoccus oryzae]|uniref:co-chaperone DjlA n=1 Tax=Methylotetracoccus oryzae TaxID=1919059 RepID=UPI001F259DA4|nr:co-chaperone DjlA [Methylotetracoccus oryzae]